jgi:hypothetical protein
MCTTSRSQGQRCCLKDEGSDLEATPPPRRLCPRPQGDLPATHTTLQSQGKQRCLRDEDSGLETTPPPQRLRFRRQQCHPNDDAAGLESTTTASRGHPPTLRQPGYPDDSSAASATTPLAWRQPGCPRDDGAVSRMTMPTSR